MYLSKEEERMLVGEYGYVTGKCMESLVEYGEAAGAEKLVDLDGIADVHPELSTSKIRVGFGGFIGAEVDLNDPEVIEGKMKVPTYSNKPVPGFIVDGWEDTNVPPYNDPEYHRRCMEGLKPWMRMGVIPTLSCDYYLVSSMVSASMVGKHCSVGESSLIPWINAILGAKGNYDGSFAAAFTGKIPMYDMHLEENRKATHLVKCKTELKSSMHYDLFGWAVGEAVELEVPVITGVGKPTVSQLVKMNSTLNTGGQIRMYHVPGLTPEAPDLKAPLKGEKPVETTTINESDLKRIYEKLNYASDQNVDFVYLGCPHYTLEEVQRATLLLAGKRCKANLWVMTGPWVFRMAEMMGYRALIRRAGGVLASGACPGMLGGLMPPNTDVMATDSAKQNYYLTGFTHPRKLQVWYGTTEECIEAAVTGKWNGAWKEG